MLAGRARIDMLFVVFAMMYFLRYGMHRTGK
jgi:hypothetical protein